MSRFIVKGMNLEMPKRLIIWDGGSRMLVWQYLYILKYVKLEHWSLPKMEEKKPFYFFVSQYFSDFMVTGDSQCSSTEEIK